MEQRSDNKIFVGGLSYQTTDYSLAVYFGQYGQLLESKIVYDRATGQSKAYGFVLPPSFSILNLASPSFGWFLFVLHSLECIV